MAIIAGPDSESLASALESMITSPELRRQLSQHALEYAGKELSTQHMGKRLVELYEEILTKA